MLSVYGQWSSYEEVSVNIEDCRRGNEKRKTNEWQGCMQQLRCEWPSMNGFMVKIAKKLTTIAVIVEHYMVIRGN